MLFAVAFAYLTLPVFIFSFSFFSTTFVFASALALVILVYSLYHEKLPSILPQKLWRYWPLYVVAIIASIAFLPYYGGLNQLRTHIILNEMGINSWPPLMEMEDETWTARYYFGWYMIPALLSKIFGSQFQVFFAVMWTQLGLFLAMLVAFYKYQRTRTLLAAGLMVFLFSGLDILAYYLSPIIYPGSSFPSYIYMQYWWTDRQNLLPLASVIGTVPNYVVGTLLPLVLFLWQRRLAVRYAAVILGVASVWNPFGAIGLIPVAAWAVLKEGKTVFSIPNLLVTPLLMLPVVLYFLQGGGHLHYGFAWDWDEWSMRSFLLFCFTEFLVIVAMLWSKQKQYQGLLITLSLFCLLCVLIHIGNYYDTVLVYTGQIAITAIHLIAIKHCLENVGWQREVVRGYFIIGVLPVIVSTLFIYSRPYYEPERRMRLAPFFEKYKHGSKNEFEDFKADYLMPISKAPHILGVPILRLPAER